MMHYHRLYSKASFLYSKSNRQIPLNNLLISQSLGEPSDRLEVLHFMDGAVDFCLFSRVPSENWIGKEQGNKRVGQAKGMLQGNHCSNLFNFRISCHYIIHSSPCIPGECICGSEMC